MLISTWPSALSRVKALPRGRFASRSRRKVPIASVRKDERQFVRRGDAEFGDTRLDVLEGAIDKLDITLGLLAEHDAKIAGRDQVLLDGLPMQVPDRRAATEQDDDDERDADRPQVQARTEAAPPGHRHVGPGLHLLALHTRAQRAVVAAFDEMAKYRFKIGANSAAEERVVLVQCTILAVNLRLRLDLRRVEVHAQSRQRRQRELAMLRRDRVGQEVLIDRVPLHQIFLDRRQERRLRQREMQPGRRGMAVRDHHQIVHRGIGGDLQRLGQPAAQ